MRRSKREGGELRTRTVGFLLQSSLELGVTPIVKYTSLSLFADRFYASLSSSRNIRNWLVQPIRESNLELFALISIWVSSKIHDSCPLSVKSLKSLGDKEIKEQHFTTRDYVEAEVVFLQVLNYDIGAGNIAFVLLEELLLRFKGEAKVGELINFEACMDIMDLLYEKEQTSILYSSPLSLAASTLVASYMITVSKQRWEFPILPWVKFVTGCSEEEIVDIVRDILRHVLHVSVKRNYQLHRVELACNWGEGS